MCAAVCFVVGGRYSTCKQKWDNHPQYLKHRNKVQTAERVIDSRLYVDPQMSRVSPRKQEVDQQKEVSIRNENVKIIKRMGRLLYASNAFCHNNLYRRESSKKEVRLYEMKKIQDENLKLAKRLEYPKRKYLADPSKQVYKIPTRVQLCQ